MQAYNKADLYNKYVQEQFEKIFEAGCIDENTYKTVLQAFPFKLYTPNYFIRIALGLLTFIAILFSGLLLWLLSETLSSNGLTALFIFLAMLCYIVLELFVRTKHYYNAGVDNTLMISVIVFTVSAVFASDFESSYLFLSGVILIVSLWLSLRFTDAFMSMLSYCASFVFIFLLYIKFGDIAKATAPFAMMIFSALIYFMMKKLLKGKHSIYRFCFQTVSLLSLITFYASGNYFVVKELSTEMFRLTENQPIPFGWFFWIFTILIPPAYIAYGVLKKDFFFIRCGLALVAATVFTVRYYYEILPAEIAMLIGGVILIAVSYALIKYLREPHYGFSSERSSSQKEIIDAEALIIAQTFGETKNASGTNALFGGGSGGGGGATGNY